MYFELIAAITKRIPAIIPHLTGKARWVAFADIDSIPRLLSFIGVAIDEKHKSVDFFERNLIRLIRSVYNNQLGGEFIDIMANLISGQLRQAVERAWADEGSPLGQSGRRRRSSWWTGSAPPPTR